MTYFTNFPKIKSTINNKSIGMIDISFGLEYDPEEFSVSSTQMGTFKTIGNLSANIYAKDANNFWGLMFANEQINPWTFLQETPSEYNNANKDYTAFYCKYSSTKLDPTAYLQLQPDDILVKGVYNPGATAAENMFVDYDTYFDSTGTNIVVNGFGDTKKAQISKTIGSTAYADLTDPNNLVGLYPIVILRKGSTGYYIANDPAIGGGGGITNLKSYNYLKSSAFFVKDDIQSVVSPTPTIDVNDSIQTVVAGDAPGATAAEVLAEQYTQISTQQSYANTYQVTSTVKYLNNSDLGTILKKLI